jgi:ketosteroid isomerase-like protein
MENILTEIRRDILEHELKGFIKKCDIAIKQEDFDTLMNYYTDDAILVIKPGMIARGKEEIKTAFIKIAKYFNNSLVPTQGEMIVLDAGDTALVISQTLLEANKNDNEYSMDRRASYVFKRGPQGEWLCAIDNSYGTDLINK